MTALDRALYRALERARHLTLALDQVFKLAVDLAQARNLDLDQVFDRDLDHAIDLAGCRALNLYSALCHARDRATIRDHDHDRHLDLARDLARDITLDCDRIGDLDLGYAFGFSITDLVDHAESLVDSLLITGDTDRRAAGVPAVPHPVARRLVEQATRCVPASHRTRYREEFLAELAEIAATRHRWGQLAYGVRLASRAMYLRRPLSGAPAETVHGTGPW